MRRHLLRDILRTGLALAAAALLLACGTPRVAPPEAPEPSVLPAPAVREPPSLPGDDAPLPSPMLRGVSRWVPVRWAQLPGLGQDGLHEAWNAWLKSCERPAAVQGALCGDMRAQLMADDAGRLAWLMSRFTPYRVESLDGNAAGLLTAYYEPLLEAARAPSAAFSVPLYQSPASLTRRRPWYSRQELETLPAAQAELRGREIAYLSDPVQALVLHIQGSGRLMITESDGSRRLVRLAFAGTNEQPYKSVGRWLLDQGLTRDASWPGISAWIRANPGRVQELLWSNPRYVFFREEALAPGGLAEGPRGAQGVALTAGRSIAVDPQSIPYGTPVWLASSGPAANLARLVLAQDTGSAITGAVRADYYAGSGAEAGELAGRLKQPLSLWVLWPKP
jgi:membrane-bound lytic murein transglycosylase A